MFRSLVTWLCCGSLGFAATYYVAPTGSDSTGNGSEGNPWQTIYYASRTRGFLSAGDTLVVRGGNYTGNGNAVDLGVGIGNSGASGNPITVQAYSGEVPVISATTAPYKGVILGGKAWWSFSGIVWSNCYSAVNMDDCTNCIFTNCIFRGPIKPADYDYPLVRIVGDSQFNRFVRCTFRDWGFIENYPSDDEKGAPLVIGNETENAATWYNLVDGCSFYHGGHDLLEIVAGYNVIRSNDFHNEPWNLTNSTYAVGHTNINEIGTPQENPYGYYGNRVVKPYDNGTNYIQGRMVFDHNRLWFTGPPPGDSGSYGIEMATHHSIYRNNTIVGALAAGIDMTVASATCVANSNCIYGNVIFGNGQSETYGGTQLQAYAGGVVFNSYWHAQILSNYFVNNIVWGNLKVNVEADVKTYSQWRTNWNQGDGAAYPQFGNTNGLTDHYHGALLTDMPSGLDFTLQAGSPCIDAGTWLAHVISASGSGSNVTVDNSLYFSDGNRCVMGDVIQLQGQTATATVLTNDWTNNVLYLDKSLTWTNGQGVALQYNGAAPDMGAFETGTNAPGPPPPGGSGAVARRFWGILSL